MDFCLIDILKSEIFWSAISSISTFIALLVAIFLPIINKRNRVKTIERLLILELKKNKETIGKLQNDNKREVVLPDKTKITGLDVNVSIIRQQIDLTLWNQYKFKLSDENPSLFNKFRLINDKIEDILLAVKEEKVYSVIFEVHINSIKEVFKSSELL